MVVEKPDVFARQVKWSSVAHEEGNLRRIVIHLHRNPNTGVWSIMKRLAAEQNKVPGVFALVGIPADSKWLAGPYARELGQGDMPPYLVSPVPSLFGSAAFLLSILSNPLRGWLRDARNAFPDAELVLHSHSAWLTGGYLPLPLDDRTAVVATFHGIADDHRLKTIRWLRIVHRFLAQRLYRSGTIMTSVSREATVRAEEIFGIPQQAFRVIPNGTPEPNVCVERVAIPTNGFLVGHVGQMHAGKGWRLLLEAVDILRREGRKVSVVLAGGGPDVELAKAEAAKRADWVAYLGVVNNASERLIPCLDALVLASWSEGMPMSIVESFAMGVPVIATPVGGIPEMLEADQNGIFIERNADSIANAIRRMMDSPELCARLRAGACETYSRRFTISAAVAHYDRLYSDALSQGMIPV